MQHIDKTDKEAAIAHIRNGRTINGLTAEYDISHVTITNWVRMYREEW